jgi:hypothetical protein
MTTAWPLALTNKRSRIYFWNPPWPMLVTGLRFSWAVWIERIDIGHRIVATDNLTLARAHPEARVCELTRKYMEWSPAPLHAGLVVPVGTLLTVRLYTEVDWAEIVQSPLSPPEIPALKPIVIEPINTEAPPPPPRSPDEAPRPSRRQRHIEQCSAALTRPALPRYPDPKWR